MVPNHALIIMPCSMQAMTSIEQMIVNTCGWDTDCNAGNVGCLLGIMLGLNGLTAGPDWRGPIADRLLISSADGGNSIDDAVRTAYYVANLGRTLAGVASLDAPKAGAQFHFSLPGSQQGFRVVEGYGFNKNVVLKNLELEGEPCAFGLLRGVGPRPDRSRHHADVFTARSA